MSTPRKSPVYTNTMKFFFIIFCSNKADIELYYKVAVFTVITQLLFIQLINRYATLLSLVCSVYVKSLIQIIFMLQSINGLN